MSYIMWGEATTSAECLNSMRGCDSGSTLMRVFPKVKRGMQKDTAFRILFCSEYTLLSEELKGHIQQAAGQAMVQYTLCYSFDEAFEQIKQSDFDIILIDADSKGSSNFVARVNEVLCWMCVSVIAVTNSYDRDNLYNIFSSGARYCISKKNPNQDILRRIFSGLIK